MDYSSRKKIPAEVEELRFKNTELMAIKNKAKKGCIFTPPQRRSANLIKERRDVLHPACGGPTLAAEKALAGGWGSKMPLLEAGLGQRFWPQKKKFLKKVKKWYKMA